MHANEKLVAAVATEEFAPTPTEAMIVLIGRAEPGESCNVPVLAALNADPDED